MDIYRVFLFDKVNITGQVIDDKTQKAMAGAKISVKGDDATEVYSDELGKYTIEVPIEKVFEMSIEFENQLVYNEQHLANVLFRDYNDNVMHLEVDIAGISESSQNEPKQIAVKMINDFDTNPVEIATSEEIEEILTLEVITPKDQSILTDNVQIDDENLPAVYFDFNKSELERPFRSQLLKLAKKLVYKSNKNLEIIGHTDLPGAESYNIGLGMKRANEIKEFLVQLGVEEHRLVVLSKGERKPVEKINTKSFKNRRAELRLIEMGDEPKKRFAGS